MSSRTSSSFLLAAVLLVATPWAAIEGADGEAPAPAKLARDCFATASTLHAGLPSAGLLQERIYVSSRNRERIERVVRESYERYSGATRRFQASASELIDRPDDPATLFRALTDGFRACWRFDGFTRLVETYGASGKDLLTILSSVESCGNFRDLAFDDAVLDRVLAALAPADDRDLEIRRLREELAELEALLDDLREIDEGR